MDAGLDDVIVEIAHESEDEKNPKVYSFSQLL